MITFSTNTDYIGTNTQLGRLSRQELEELLLNDNDLTLLTPAQIDAKINAMLDVARAHAFQDVCEKLPSFTVQQLTSLIGRNSQLREAEIASVLFRLIKNKRTRVDDATYARIQNDYVEYFGNFGGNIIGILGEFNKGTRKLFDVSATEIEGSKSASEPLVGAIVERNKTDKTRYSEW